MTSPLDLVRPAAVAAPDRAPSSRRRIAVVAAGVLAGFAAAVLWSAKLVDDLIGARVADGLLGDDAAHTTLTGGVTGAVFAFVIGLAGTFTACNIAAFSAVGPMLAADRRGITRLRSALTEVGWLSLGMVAVAAVYGAVGAAVGDGLPQLSTATVGHGMPVRIVQSMIVFAALGLVFLWLGLGAIGVVPDVLGRLSARRPHAPTVLMGALIGAFLIGRPYPLFFRLFQEAAHDHDPFFGALAFTLTAVGNIVVLAVAYLLLATIAGPAPWRWLAARPHRLATVTAVALLAGGSFMLFYWGVRLPARFDYGWFPASPWG
jgi:hypothetical protein